MRSAIAAGATSALFVNVRYGYPVALGEETAGSCRGALLAAIQTEHARQVQRQAARFSDIARNAANARLRIASPREPCS